MKTIQPSVWVTFLANLSIIRAIALNILRRNGYPFITKAQRFISNDIDKLLYLVE